jgi:peptidoglycan/LPS O-acetylase OafA/YrhL
MQRTLPEPARSDGRHREVDAVRGLAILGVLLIHANPLQENAFHQIVVNRAVAVFLVLFGVSSELWWDRRSDPSSWATSREYYRSRLTRLLPPVWVALAAWWVLMPALGKGPAPRFWWVLPHALGYMPQVGMGWFVTLIVQLVLLFPLLHLALRLLGPIAACGIGLAIMTWSQLHPWQVIDCMRVLLFDTGPTGGLFIFYYLWIFAPSRFLALFAGMILARHGVRIPNAVSIAAAVCFVAGAWLEYALLRESPYRNLLSGVLDIALTVALLASVRVACPAGLANVLAWLGRASWSIYLGQLVAHNAFGDLWLHTFGGSALSRWVYFGCLLLSGLLAVACERGIRRSFGAPTGPGPYVAGVQGARAKQ